jgi:uncharacterized protein (DUF3084 family)
MSELTDGLDKLIQKAALDGALTPEAVAQFHSLVTQCDAQAGELRELQKVNTDIVEKRDELSRKVKIMLDDANELSTRAAAIEADEDEHRNRKVQLECANLRVTDHQEMFRVVFRNAVVRREVVTPGSASFDQYNTKTDNFPDKTPVEEEET